MPVSPRQEFARLRAFGRDRAKFLHNFCTNNIRDLIPGTACEAFFTDVKARILAHGYVLALEHFHEIWLLPGDSEALLKHLTRYVITEDVRFELVSSSCNSITVACTPMAIVGIGSELAGVSDQPLHCFTQSIGLADGKSFGITGLCFAWADRPLNVVCGESEFIEPFAARLAERGILPISADEFDQLRIEERFPLVGLDILLENLAPEAERNAASISYTKGCYLGQEPIARLDAMGHINRALRIVELECSCLPETIVGSSLQTSEGAVIGTITSAYRVSPTVLKGLAMVRLSLAGGSLHVLLSSGDQLTAKVLP